MDPVITQISNAVIATKVAPVIKTPRIVAIRVVRAVVIAVITIKAVTEIREPIATPVIRVLVVVNRLTHLTQEVAPGPERNQKQHLRRGTGEHAQPRRSIRKIWKRLRKGSNVLTETQRRTTKSPCAKTHPTLTT